LESLGSRWRKSRAEHDWAAPVYPPVPVYPVPVYPRPPLPLSARPSLSARPPLSARGFLELAPGFLQNGGVKGDIGFAAIRPLASGHRFPSLSSPGVLTNLNIGQCDGSCRCVNSLLTTTLKPLIAACDVKVNMRYAFFNPTCKSILTCQTCLITMNESFGRGCLDVQGGRIGVGRRERCKERLK
jgi:hypothetical protein